MQELGDFLGTALIVGIVGPLFWLGVNVLETKVRSLIGKARGRSRQQAGTQD